MSGQWPPGPRPEEGTSCFPRSQKKPEPEVEPEIEKEDRAHMAVLELEGDPK